MQIVAGVLHLVLLRCDECRADVVLAGKTEIRKGVQVHLE